MDSTIQNIKFNRRHGTSGISGQLYEINLLMLLLMKVSKHSKGYFLATNMDEARDFDDIVLKYNLESSTEIIFLQAKHRDNPEKDKITLEQLFSESEKGDFNLKKYFNSYRKIKQEFLVGNDDPIFGSSFETVNIIIYTNALSNFSQHQESVNKVNIENDNILNFTEKNIYYYKLVYTGENNVKRITILQESSDCKKLAKHLAECIATGKCLNINEGILRDYYIPLLNEVIEKVPNENEGKIKENFLSGNSQLKRAILEEVIKKNEFIGKSKSDLMSELHEKCFKLPDQFGKRKCRDGKYPESLPDDLVNNDEIKEFLNKLHLFVNQPSEEDLGKIMKQKLQEEYNIKQEDIEVVYSTIKNKILEWWLKGKYYLLETNRIFSDSIGISIRFDVKEPVTLFTGRTKELEELHELIQMEGKVLVSQATSVTGLGGIGKSELARKYVSKHNKDYDDNIIWINADNNTSIETSFYRLAEERLGINIIDLNKNKKDIKSVILDVYDYFRKRHRKSIFVFDNAEKYKSCGEKDEGIDKFFPRGDNKPYILITSRNQEWGDIQVLPLDVFSEIEAIQFLQKALKDIDDISENDMKDLAGKLQNFPLALRQAASYISNENKNMKKLSNKHFTINDYIKNFKDTADNLLGKPLYEEQDRYTMTVLTTWTITINKIKRKMGGSSALKALNIIAYLAPYDIPADELFQNLIKDDEERSTSLLMLDQYSMINLDQGLLNIHRLVQHVTRIELKNQRKDTEIVKDTFILLEDNFPLKDNMSEGCLKKKKLLPHLEVFVTHVSDFTEEQKIESQFLVTLLTWLDNGYFILGIPQKHKELLERALPIFEKHFGPKSLNVSQLLANLGNAWGELGNINNEKKFLELALNLEKEYYGENHEEVAITMGDLGITYKKLGDFHYAKKLLQKSLDILEKKGVNDIKKANIVENLGNVYGDLGNHKQEKEFLKRALEIEKDYYGSNHFQVAITRSNLGCVYNTLGKPLKAKELYELALPILEEHYGHEHFKVANVLASQGSCFVSLGEPKMAKIFLDNSLQILQKHYGADHFEVGKILSQLGTAHEGLGNLPKAKELFEKALIIFKTFFSADHLEIGKLLTNLGSTYRALGCPKEAKEHLKKSITIIQKYFDNDNLEIATSQLNLGSVYLDLGKSSKAINLLEKALNIVKKHYSSNNFQITPFLENLGLAYREVGKYEQAIEFIKQTLEIKEHHYGDNHFEVAKSLDNLGVVLGLIGKYIQGKKMLEQALQILLKHFGDNHILVAQTMVNLSVAKGALGEHEEKKKLLEQALSIYKNNYGCAHAQVAKVLLNLGVTYGNTGNIQKEIMLLKEAISIFDKTLGHNHCLVAKTLINLGKAYNNLGEYLPAIKVLTEALEILRQCNKPDDILIPVTLRILGTAYYHDRQYGTATQLLEQALSELQMNNESNQIEIAHVLLSLSNIYNALGDQNRRQEFLVRALPIYEKHEPTKAIEIQEALETSDT